MKKTEDNNGYSYEELKTSIDDQLRRIEQCEINEGFNVSEPEPEKKKESFFSRILKFFKGK